MLQTTSLRRPRAGGGDRSYNPADTAPPVVRPASPFAPTGTPTPAPDPPRATEIEPDDDELVILTTGDATTPPTSSAPAVEVAPTEPERRAGTKKAPAKKAPATKAPAKASKKAAARKASATKAPAKAASARTAAWVEPVGGVCPTTHPVKAKLRSAIFHLPGMAAYARTSPDRCYRDEDAATDDGLRKAAR